MSITSLSVFRLKAIVHTHARTRGHTHRHTHTQLTHCSTRPLKWSIIYHDTGYYCNEYLQRNVTRLRTCPRRTTSSIRLLHPVLTTYASKPIKVYLIKSYITETMLCIASSRPSLIPPIITALDHAHMTDHSPNDSHI